MKPLSRISPSALVRWVGKPGSLDLVADRVVDGLRGHARPYEPEREVEPLEGEAVPFGDLGGWLTGDERSRHVREAGRPVVPRPDVHDHRLAGADGPLAEMMADRRLRPVRGHEDVRGSVVLDEGGGDLGVEHLARQRRPVDLENLTGAGHGGRQQLARTLHSGVGRGLGPPDPLELGSRLDPAAVGEEVAIGLEDEPFRAQPVGRVDREGARNEGSLDTERPDGPDDELLEHLVVGGEGAPSSSTPYSSGAWRWYSPAAAMIGASELGAIT